MGLLSLFWNDPHSIEGSNTFAASFRMKNQLSIWRIAFGIW